MKNNIEKSLILVETEQLDFLPKEFKSRQSIQKKLMLELNNDLELIRTYHCVKNTSEAELLVELKQYEDTAVNSTNFMELPEFRRFLEEQFYLERTSILNDCVQGFYYTIQPSHEEKNEITGVLPKHLEKRI